MEDYPVFLHVGCGSKRQNRTPFAGKPWRELRLDIDSSIGPDIIGSITDMREVKDNSVDAVYSSHNIEHLYPHEVPIALKEFNRVLKPEGFLLITCPDLQPVCKLIAEDKLTDPAYQSKMGPISPIDIIYGHRNSIQEGNIFMAHRCGFTRKVLSATLANAGFTVAAKSRPKHFDLWAIGGLGKDKEWLGSHAQEFFPA